MSTHQVDVLVVGAGPTGLALAAQLQAFGTDFRVVDRQAAASTASPATGSSTTPTVSSTSDWAFDRASPPPT